MIARRVFLAGAAVAPLALRDALGATEFAHVSWAQRLVRELAPENNVYGSRPTYVVWADLASGRPARNRSVCSSFVSHLLEQSYGFIPPDFAAWFRAPNPQAGDYYDTIVAERGFRRVHRVMDIQSGDLIAVKYPPGSRPSGHVMLAVGLAVPTIASVPLHGNTSQWALTVVDCSHSRHGTDDTRSKGGASGTGVGRGVIRLYAREDGTLAGYTWSTLLYSSFRSQSERRAAIGRLDLALAPRPTGQPASSPLRPAQEPSAPADDAADDD